MRITGHTLARSCAISAARCKTEFIALRPDWAGTKDDPIESEKGKASVVRVVVIGNGDDRPEWHGTPSES